MIKYLIMDVDGTLTDGKIYIDANGELMKAFNIKDGYGIHDMLIPSGISPVIITGRKSKIVENRCRELGIVEIYQGVNNKVEKMKELTKDLSVVAYIGDDINDLSCLKLLNEKGGLTGCPADAVIGVRRVCNFVSEHKGGDGAVREFIEWILKTNEDE